MGFAMLNYNKNQPQPTPNPSLSPDAPVTPKTVKPQKRGERKAKE